MVYFSVHKGGLISKDMFKLVPSSRKCAKSLSQLFMHGQDRTKLKIHSENKPRLRKIEDILRILVIFNISCMIDAWFDKVAPINECMHRCFRFGVNYSDF